MNYLIKDGDKYDVYLDKEKIIHLRDFLIKNYSIKIPRYGIKYDYCPSGLHNMRIDPFFRNIDVFYGMRSAVEGYEYYYDEYINPPIVDLINEILRGNYKVLEKVHSNTLKESSMTRYYKKLESYIKIVKRNNQNNTFVTDLSSKRIVQNFVKRLTRRK